MATIKNCGLVISITDKLVNHDQTLMKTTTKTFILDPMDREKKKKKLKKKKMKNNKKNEQKK